MVTSAHAIGADALGIEAPQATVLCDLPGGAVSFANYDDVLGQLRSAGLIVDSLITGKIKRCKIEGDREERGWYCLHEIVSGGDVLLVGSFGVWRGSDNGATKIELHKRELTAEQRDALRKRLREDRQAADRARAASAAKAAARADAAWKKCTEQGESAYLARKQVPALGLRFSPSGTAVVPIRDVSGRLHGLQLLRSGARGGSPAKQYWPAGVAIKAHFHLIGVPTDLILVAEGYATGASLHLATQRPVAVAFDAGNIGAVVAALRKRYRQARILICADDDAFFICPHCKTRGFFLDNPETCAACGKSHGRLNAGICAASSAALASSAAWCVPGFADDAARRAAFLEHGTKLTDFNDLHASAGAAEVAHQIDATLAELGWQHPARATPTPSGGGGDDTLRPLNEIGALLDRYVLVYGQGGMVFDRQEHCLVKDSDVRDVCQHRELYRAWAEHSERAIVRLREVGFDPGGVDPVVTCNLWSGWPTEPKSGRCEKLLELLRYMCSGEHNNERLYRWVLAWIAYPIQHPGAKMRTTLVIHGPQGTGKNLFFESLMAIYGHYGRIIDQTAVEDKFNDWASRKLFLIADEVVARSDLYHVKNKLKAFITGDWIRINPKNFAAYDERNHVNVVFLSNESMPVVLEDDDRRHTVIRTPEKLAAEFYETVRNELAAEGAAALHHHLLHLDLGDFNPGTPPPVTSAKNELIALSTDTPARFFDALMMDDIDGITPRPALSTDVFALYQEWCRRTAGRTLPMPRFVNDLRIRREVLCLRKRYADSVGGVVGPRGVLFLGKHECPPDHSEATWLGDHIAAFAQSVSDYRGLR